jgi:ornithine decarboxylase
MPLAPAPFAATRHLDTPFLLLDPAAAARAVGDVRAALPGVEVYYALKANPHPALAAAVAAVGAGFEVASPAELRQLLAAGVSPHRLMCLHPVKAPTFLLQLAQAGVGTLAVDAAEEVEKVATLAPGSRVLVRVDVPNHGSRHPLRRKFGCPPGDVVRLLQLARDRGLRPAGLTTHVGSQCERLATWATAADILATVAREAADVGLPAEVVSLGGGLPVAYTAEVPSLDRIGRVLTGFAPGARVTVEPGRAIAAPAGTLFASVIGLADRPDGRWAYLDAGLHHGLGEALPAAGGIVLPAEAEGRGRRQPYTLAGPTCDGLDALPTAVELPELRVGDRVAFLLAGAYSTSLSRPFNGYPVPVEVVAPSRR